MKINRNNYQEYSPNTIANLVGRGVNEIHMVVGIVSELNELEDAIEKGDKVNIGEEVADCCWYISNLCAMGGIRFTHLLQNEEIVTAEEVNDSTIISSLYYYSSKLQDIFKKYLAYGKEPAATEVYDLCFFLANALNKLMLNHELDLDEYLDRNIKKLMQRFPDKFSESAAVNRDLKAERAILEGNKKHCENDTDGDGNCGLCDDKGGCFNKVGDSK